MKDTARTKVRKRAGNPSGGLEGIHRLLLDESPDPIFAFSPEGRYLYVNRAFAEGVERSVDQIVGRAIWDVFPRPEAEQRFAALSRVIESGVETVIEVRVPRSDGDRHFVTTITPILDPAGRVATVICSSKDITQRKRAETALLESQEITRAISQLVINYTFIADVSAEGRPKLRWTSDNLLTMTGRRLDEATTPESWLSIIHPDDLPGFQAFVRRLIETGEAGEFECRSLVHGGTIRWIQIFGRPKRGADGRVSTIYGAVKDISWRKQAEIALQQSEARYAAFMDFMPALILIKDHESRILYANARFKELFPFALWEGRPPHQLFPAPAADELVARDAEALEKGSISYEESWPGSDGKLRHFRTISFRIGVQGSPPLLGAIIIDITEQRRNEEERERLRQELTQAQKLETVGRLAGGVAHDFNNMLQAILGYAEIALAKTKPGHPLHSDLEQIRQTARRSADLTRQLLAFARKQAVEPKVLELNQAVAGTLGMVRRLIGEGIELVWKPGEGPKWVRIDPSQIDQVLTNLCLNARDAIEGMGRITIETGAVALRHPPGRLLPEFLPGDYVMLSLSDDGRGMTPDVMEHIFEPFFTTKEVGQGTGLGLPMVYGIVRQNGGFVDAASRPGQGTTLRIYLPRQQAPAVERRSDDPAPRICRGEETVLVVEDEPAILQMCRAMLTSLGYRVLPASTPTEAVRLASEAAAPIHLLITDVILPEMNGRDLAERIHALHPGLKRLFMSGYPAHVIDGQGVLDRGVHFIQKPFSLPDLASGVREALAGN